MRRVLAAFALLPILSACGSGGGSGASAFTSAQGVADKAGLTSCASSETGHDFVDEVTCGDRAIVMLFDTTRQRSKWASNYLVNGLPSGAGVLYDGRWGIACEQKSTCSAIQGTLGGTLKP